MSARHSVQRTLAAVASVSAAVAWVGCMSDSADEAPDAGGSADDPAQRVSSAQPGRPVVRGCRDRAEGGRLLPNRERDTVIGPVAFPYLVENYREAARPDSRRSKPPADFNAHPVKALALIRSGTRVTLSVPRAQRSWMQLLYHPSAVWRGSLRVTLQACRWHNTQFNGAIYIDFDRAPNRVRCARLAVQIERRQTPLEQPLFRPEPGSCT
jgi:hypothetical protein